MKLLPNHERAIIDLQKIKDYCLSDKHPIGKHKAKVFKSALSLRKNDAENLINLIKLGLKSNQAYLRKKDVYGDHYFVDMEIINFDESAIIRTAWIFGNGVENPKLITCYIL